ncbi:MAG: InlB B-repeat-containing protein [Prevotella sp.]|nr:InlB B-repeat-containing protein [Prevotella sp.]
MKSIKNNILTIFCLVALSIYSLTAMAGAQGYHASSFGQCGTVTGGGNATPTLVSTANDLKNALTASGSAVIIITQDIEMPYTSVVVKDKTILALPGVKLYSNEQTATTSGILYFKSGTNNVIMRNLTFEGPGAYDCDGRDNLCFDGATNVWVDHCDFQDGCDGNFDNKGNTDNITVSWCRFHYLKAPKAGGSGGSDDHRFTNLIGSSSSQKPSDGAYTMTWAYCWWDEGCRERMPRVRNADLHMLNCVWTSSVANYYVGPENARVRFDGCYFGSLSADKIFKSYGGTNAAVYNNCYSAKGATLTDANASKIASISYSYDVLTPSVAYSNVTNATYGAGATLNVTTAGVITEGDGSIGGGGSTPSTTKTVSVSAGEGGIASASASSVESGASVTFTATPSSGYEFVNWTNNSGTAVSTANPYVATITENTALKANFASTTACDVTAATINGVAAAISGTTVKATIPYTAGTTIPVVLTLSANATSNAGISFNMTLAGDAGATVGKTVTITAKDGRTSKSYTITLTRAANATVLEANGASVAANGTFTNSTCTTSIKFSSSTEVSDGSDKSPLSTSTGTVYRSSDATSITLGLASTSASQIVLAARSTGSGERTVTGVSVDGVALGEGDYMTEGTVENNQTVYRVTISGLNVSQGSTVTINTSGNVHYYYFEITPASEVTPATKSDDATLSDLKVSGTTVTGFSSATTTYDVELASGTTVVPTVTYTVNEEHATAVVNVAPALPGSTTVVVTAEDGSSKTYAVNFTVAEPVSESTTVYSFNDAVGTTTASTATYEKSSQTLNMVTLTGTESFVISKNDNAAWVKIIPKSGYTFKNGDVVTLTGKVGTDGKTVGLYICTSATRNTNESVVVASSTSNKNISTQASGTLSLAADASELYLYRYDGTGTTITSLEITRGGSPPKSSVCTLSDLKSGGTTVTGFNANTLVYNIELAEGTTAVPAVVATCTDSKASASVNYGSISNNAATTTVTVTAEDGTQKVYTINYTVAAPVVVTTYSVSVNAGTGGSATVSPSGTVVAGSEVVFTATAASGYTFSGWSDSSVENPHIVTVNGDVTLTANFTKQSDTSGRSWGIDGFAAYEGTPNTAHYHAGGTTGGAGGKVVKATNFTELQAYLQSNDPYIILVDRDITTGVTAYVDDLSTGHLCDSQDGSDGVATTYGERIMVQSNKTLIGIADANGKAPLISRISLILQCAHNVIIRNCRFTMNGVPVMRTGENKIVAMRDGVQTEVGDPDCIGIQADATSASTDSGSHIWIDHCEFFNGNAANVDRYDGLVDIKNNVQWITLSYNHFHDHYKACLFGKGDSDNYDRTITMHHNMFENISGSRLPLQRYGHLHYMNNYMTGASDGYDLRAGSVGYVDACYFKDSKAPIRLRGEGSVNINLDPEYSIVYDNCLRIINNNSNFTYLNQSKVDEEYAWSAGGTNSNSWLPAQTWSGYFVHNHDKVNDVPAVCEQYSGAGKVVLWDDYTNTIPAEDMEEVKRAVVNSSYSTYNVDGTKFIADATEADEYDVKFYSVGIQVGATQSVESGAHATAPADPERDGYTFGGWSTTDGGTTSVNVATYTITSATNFYAIWTANAPEVSDELELTDAANYVAGTYEAGHVTYTRSTSDGNYGSFCLPFDFVVGDATGIEKVYVPVNIALYNTSTGKLQIFLKNATGTITAGTPFIALFNGNTSVANSASATFTAAMENPAPQTFRVFDTTGSDGALLENEDLTITWNGTYVSTAKVDGMMSFNRYGDFNYHGSSTLGAFRAYIVSSSSSNNANSIDVELIYGGETAIDEIVLAESGNKVNVYSVVGRQIKSKVSRSEALGGLSSGVYIVNGKKIVK